MKQTSPDENKIVLHGRLSAAPVFSHQNHEQMFYTFPLLAARLSGAEDRINVVAGEQVLKPVGELLPGQEVTVRGEVRTYNNRSGEGSKLVISVFARSVVPEPGMDVNRLRLSGTLCKPPVLRVTPLGRSICDMILAVNRRYGRADYLPCITWGSLAHRCGEMSVGDRIRLEGRFQSRAYTKVLEEGAQERTAFEVSAMEVRPVRDGQEEEWPEELTEPE